MPFGAPNVGTPSFAKVNVTDSPLEFTARHVLLWQETLVNSVCVSVVSPTCQVVPCR